MNKPSVEMRSTSHRYGRSLNAVARKRELQRITLDNQKILRRIQAAEPVYNHWKWEEDGIEHAKLVASISEYGSGRSVSASALGRKSRGSISTLAARNAAAASTMSGVLSPSEGSGMDFGAGAAASASSSASSSAAALPRLDRAYEREAHARAAAAAASSSSASLPAHARYAGGGSARAGTLAPLGSSDGGAHYA